MPPDLRRRSMAPFPALVATVILGACCDTGGRPDHRPDSGGPIGTLTVTDLGWGEATGYHLAWAIQAGGAYNGDIGGDSAWSLAFAPDGDLFVGGRLYSDDVLFGSGTGSEITFNTWERGALFLARYDGDGVPLWVASIQPDKYEVTEVLPHDDGSVVAVGRVSSDDFHPPVFGAGEPGETVLAVSCDNCPFLARYRPDGTFDWVAHGDGYRGGATSLARTASGDYCVAGWFQKNMVFDEGTAEGLAIEDETGTGGMEGFAARFNENGVALWARRIRAPGLTTMNRVVSLPGESCAYLGYFEGFAAVDSGGEEPVTVEGGGQWSSLLAVYDAGGALVWARDIGIAGLYDGFLFEPAGLAPVGGDLVAAGMFNGDLVAGSEESPIVVLAGPSSGDRGLFVMRLRGSDGARLWTSVALGTSSDDYAYDAILAVAGHPGGGVVVGGSLTGMKTFGAGESREATLVATGPNADAFLAVYGDDGLLHWAVRVVSSPHMDWKTANEGEYVTSVDVDLDGSILASGTFLKTATFGAGPDDSTVLDSFGGYDAFVLRLEPDEVPLAR